MGARKLGRLLGVNKNTAWSMVLRIKIAMMEHRELLTKIGSVLPIPTTV